MNKKYSRTSYLKTLHETELRQRLASNVPKFKLIINIWKHVWRNAKEIL